MVGIRYWLVDNHIDKKVLKMDKKIIHIEVDFDKEKLIQESKDYRGYETFLDPLNQTPIDGWKIKRINDGYGMEISNKIKEIFNLNDCRPRFYIQTAGVDIPFHTDRGTKCSFNFILSENADPITFRDGIVYYQNALLNTSVDHSVVNTKYDRTLFKVSVFDKTFEEIANDLSSKLRFR
jgi:hypothetical protein